MSKKPKNKKRKSQLGKTLTERLYTKKLKKAAKNGDNLFVCEPHAHHKNACGIRFASKHGWVECPGCGNQYCRWINYKESDEPLVP